MLSTYMFRECQTRLQPTNTSLFGGREDSLQPLKAKRTEVKNPYSPHTDFCNF